MHRQKKRLRSVWTSSRPKQKKKFRICSGLAATSSRKPTRPSKIILKNSSKTRIGVLMMSTNKSKLDWTIWLAKSDSWKRKQSHTKNKTLTSNKTWWVYWDQSGQNYLFKLVNNKLEEKPMIKLFRIC